MSYENPEIRRPHKEDEQPFITQIEDQDGEIVQLEWNGGEIIITTWNKTGRLFNSPNIPYKILLDEIDHLAVIGIKDEESRRA